MKLSDIWVGSTWRISHQSYNYGQHMRPNKVYLVREVERDRITFAESNGSGSWTWTFKEFSERFREYTVEKGLLSHTAVLLKLLSDEKSLSGINEALVRLEI